MAANQVVLAVFPNTRGFGYACVQGKDRLLDAGIANIRPVNNHKVVDRMMAYLDYFRPALVLVRDPAAGPESGQRKRAAELVERMVAMCDAMRLPVFRYTREQVNDVFSACGITSKHGIAEALAARFKVTWDVPRKARAYEKEDYHMGKFDALALVVAHCYLTE